MNHKIKTGSKDSTNTEQRTRTDTVTQTSHKHMNHMLLRLVVLTNLTTLTKFKIFPVCFFYPNKSRLCCFSNYDRFPLVINNILNLCVWYLHFSDRISPLHCFLMSLVIRKHNPAAFAVFYFIFIKHLILRKMFFFSWIRPWLFLVFTDILRL